MMKNNYLKTAVAALCGLLAGLVEAQAYDFEKDGIFYEITSLADRTVSVTEGTTESSNTNPYQGTVSIPESVEWNEMTFTVTGIGHRAFAYSELTGIHFPKTLTFIQDYAFEYTPLRSISIPDHVTSIGEFLFTSCQELTEVTLPDGLTRIPDRTFRYCSKLSALAIPAGVETIGDWAFDGCTSLRAISLPDKLTEIGKRAFKDCDSLTAITIPAAVKAIGTEAFDGCANLTSVTWHTNQVTSLDGTFGRCTNLQHIEIPNGVTFINSIFTGCTRLKSVLLPETLQSIRQDTFEDCDSLTSLTLNAPTPPELIYTAFPISAYLNTTLRVPKDCKPLYENAENWSNFQHIVETDYVPTTFCPLTAKASGQGTISFGRESLSNGTATWSVPANATTLLRIRPDYGYTATVTITQADGSETTAEATDALEVEVGTEPLTVEVTFEKIILYLTIQQAGSGCVEVEAEYGKTRTVRITPYEGWRIHSVTLDGTDYTARLDADNRFTTPELLEDAFLNVAFEQDGSRVRGLQADATKVYAQDGRLVVEQAGAGTVVRVYDEGGQLVRSLAADGGRMTATLPQGHIYLVRTAQKTVKIKL